MTRFLPMDVCEILIKLGCQSDSGFLYGVRREDVENLIPNPKIKLFYGTDIHLHGYSVVSQAFDKLDVLEVENAKKIWPGKLKVYGWDNKPFAESMARNSEYTLTLNDAYVSEREKLINLPGDEWIEAVRKAANEAIEKGKND